VARPIQYDKEDVLIKVMKVFWNKGYQGTSIRDLVTATGLNTRTMYNLFGGKEGLFLEALDTYNKNYFHAVFSTMKSNPGFRGVELFFEEAGKFISFDGCLFVNTLKEKTNIDSVSFCRAKDFFKKLEGQFRKNLSQAKRDGVYSGSAELDAKLLVTFVHGLSLTSRLEHSKSSGKELVKTFLSKMAV